MRGIKKIEHITTYRTFCVDTDNILYDKSTIINEAYIITYVEGQMMIAHNYKELPKKAKKFFFRKYNYSHSYHQEFRYSLKHTAKIDTYTFKDPI